MRGLSPDVLRVGKKYRLVNFNESNDFEVEQILSNGDMTVKDIHTLERYQLSELTRYGKGNDFEIRELDHLLPA